MQETDDPTRGLPSPQPDKATFEHLLGPVIVPAARLAYLMLLSHAEAEDVVQEAAIKAWRKFRQLRSEADFPQWFFGIVANECRTVKRSKWWAVLSLERAASRPRQGPEGTTVTSTDLRAALMRLAPDQRAAILLHFYIDLPLDQVAQALQISVPGVKSRINRALKILRPGLRNGEART